MENMKLDGQADRALNRIQDTQLTPMEEVLFKSWTKANDIKKPDNVDDGNDYRGIWKETQGKVLPWGSLKDIASRVNAESQLKKSLTERMTDHVVKSEQQAKQTAKANTITPTQGQK